MKNKNVKNFCDFLLEFSSHDKNFIQQMSDHFTLSVEYELVANFEIDEEPDPADDEYLDRNLAFVKKQTLLDLSRGKLGYTFAEEFKFPKAKLLANEEQMKTEQPKFASLDAKKQAALHKKYTTWTWMNDFIDSLIAKIDIDDDELTDKRINKAYKTDLEDHIATMMYKNIHQFVFDQNMAYLVDMFQEKMPKFFAKWADEFKYELEGDVDKQRILEFSSRSYLKGLNECFEQLDDFYNEFEQQDFWLMNERTALHVNIGIRDAQIKWNPIKGLVLMSDVNRDEKTPFVFSDIMWRITNRFTQSLLDGIKRNISGEIKDDWRTTDKVARWNLAFRHREELGQHRPLMLDNIEKLDLHNIPQVEDFLNPFLIQANSDFYIKEFGVKITELAAKNKYVEFRYVGGNVGRKLMKDKVLYFCYIVYLMTNGEYKQKEYHKKLYKYVEEIKEILEAPEYDPDDEDAIDYESTGEEDREEDEED